MAEGLTYMIVDPETGQGVEQTATSLMAVEGGDGKQQFAVPVMDPETGQQTYMLLDQEQLEAQNIHITSEGEGENQQFMIVNSEGDGLQQMVGEGQGQEQGYAMVEGGQEVMVMVEGQGAVMAQVGQGGQVVNMGNGEEKEGFSSEALEWESKLRADGTEAAGEAKEGSNDPYDIGGDFAAIPVKKQPRKQNLVIVHPDYSGKDEEEKVENPGKYYPKHPPGLSGNIEQDKKLVDKKVEEICMSVDMTSREIDQLRVSLMTRGLTAHAITGATTAYSPGRGARSSYVRGGYRGVVMGRGRGRGRGRPARPPREIKCDKCGKAFPSNVDESVLVHHIKTFHLNPKQWACTKCDKVLASEMALKYHTCSDTKFKCQDCNKLFMQKSTLMEHMAVAHGPIMEKSPEKPEIRKVLEQDWDDEEEEDVDDPKAQNGSSQNQQNKEINEETPPRTIVMNAKVVEDFANENEDSGKSQVQSESVPKEDEDDEDKIVADVDDILNDTDRLVGSLKDIVDDKRKTSVIRKRKDFARGPVEVKDPTLPAAKAIKTSPPKPPPTIEKPKISMKQCETCYECFETDEKLAWHDLHVHAPPAIKPDDDL